VRERDQRDQKGAGGLAPHRAIVARALLAVILLVIVGGGLVFSNTEGIIFNGGFINDAFIQRVWEQG